MNKKILFDELNKRLILVDLHKIHKDLKLMKYGVYLDGNLETEDDSEPFFSSYSDRNFYNDIVIIEELEDDYDIMSAYLVSKMFKQYIFTNYSKMIPNHLKMLFYPQNYLDIQYSNYEHKILLKAHKNKDYNVKLQMFRLALNIRKLRGEIIDKDFFDELAKLETISGLVVNSFFVALEQINGSKAKHVKNNFIEDHSGFKKENMNNVVHSLGSGFLYYQNLRMLELKNYDFNMTIFNNGLLNVEFINENIRLISSKTLIQDVNNYNDEVKDMFSNYFACDPKKISFKGKIHSFDPNKMYKLDDQIYHTQYVVLINDSSNELVYLQGPVVTKIKEGTYDNVICYFIDK